MAQAENIVGNAAQSHPSNRWTEIHFSYQPTLTSEYCAIRELHARRFGIGLEFIFMSAAVVVFALIVVFAAVLLGENGWLALAKEGMGWWLLPGMLAAALPALQCGQVLVRRLTQPSSKEKLTFSINTREIAVRGETIRSYIPWSAVSSVLETREYYHVYSVSRLVFSISKKAMGRAACEQMTLLIGWIFEKRTNSLETVAG
jgi:YcxB-like protein